MRLRESVAAGQPLCQSRDKHDCSEKRVTSPTSTAWKLTKQQQAFIDLFAEDDHKKQ